MTTIEFADLCRKEAEERDKILRTKGHAYSGGKDAFANFKRNAERLQMSKYKVWQVYFQKHLDAITTAINDNPENPVDKSEGLDGRIRDAINYLNLLQGMLREENTVFGGTIDASQLVATTITEDRVRGLIPFPVDSNDPNYIVPAGGYYRPPGDSTFYKIVTDTPLKKFVIGTDFYKS